MATTTVESLVNSLQSYLTTQIPLIPALHTQLGLPQSALTDELAELHKSLIECVDKKIEERRKEVEDWMSKCEEIEDECIKLTKALGSHTKTLASTVGELRKQQALPKRFDLLNVYQDKLHQIYLTKYEQGMGLVTKINSFVHVLGDNFFSPDTSMMIPIPGMTEDDPHSFKDVTPERFSKLEKELVRAKGEITRRRILLSQTFWQIGVLHEDLGLPYPAETEIVALPKSISGTSSVTSSASDPFMSSIRSSFGSSSLSNKHSDDELRYYSAVFAQYISRLQEASDESLDIDGPGNDTFGVENVEPTTGLVNWVVELKTDLVDLKTRREAHIQMIYEELEVIWHRLGVSEEDRTAFIEANVGSTEANVQAYERELERMLELKREGISTMIENARAEIKDLWDEIILGEEERGAFAPFADNEHTEELLILHEQEIRKLKEEQRIKAPILATLKKYFEVCTEEKELAAASADQSRLLGRGPRDPGRLLREEKMRKRVTKEKPRLEKELLSAISTWECEYTKPFLVNGVGILEVITDVVADEAEKENRKRNRPGSVPPRGTTPQPGDRSTSAPAGHYSETKNSANKRPRLATSQNTNTNGYHHSGRSSPIKPSETAKPGKQYGLSSLPRPVSVPRHNGHGHREGPLSTGVVPRVTSNPSVSSNASLFNKRAGGGRQASFRPRPSADNTIRESASSSIVGNARAWTQLMTRVQEEAGY